MAIYHLSAKIISRSTGRSATGAAAYRSGSEIVDERTGLVHNYTRKGGVDGTALMAPAGAPEWATDRARLWNEVEQIEKRKDAQVAREIVVAIPRELSREQMAELVTGFAQDQFVKKGMVADVAFHHLDSENPHAHIMLTTRSIGPDGFGQKAREWNDKALLEQWRQQWEQHANKALEMTGHETRIDHRSLEAQGIERAPTVHLGPTATAIERRGAMSERGDTNRERQQLNAQVIDLAQARARMEQQRTDHPLTTDTAALERQRKARLAQERRELREAHETAEIKALVDLAEPTPAPATAAMQAADQLATQAQTDAHQVDTFKAPAGAPRTITAADRPELEKRWQTERAAAFKPIQEKAQRIQAKAEQMKTRQGQRLQAHEKTKPAEPKGIKAMLGRAGYEQGMQTWDKAKKQLEKRWHQLRERVERVAEYAKEGFDMYLSKGQQLAEKRLQRDKPELYADLQTARTAEVEQRRQKAQEQASERQQQRELGKQNKGFER
jgi:hypothetical protein